MSGQISWLAFSVIFLMFKPTTLADQNDEDHDLETKRTANATKTLDLLFKSYDKRLRPKFGGRPVTVYVDLYIVDIGEISVTSMDYRMTMYFRQTWQDPRLRFSGTSQIVAQGDLLDKIWIPDTYFKNEKRSNFHEITKKNYVLIFWPNGTVFFSIRISVIGVCRMKLHKYPMDSQKCQLNIMSYSYSEADAIYTWKRGHEHSVEQATDISLPQMDLVRIEGTETTDVYSTETYLPSIMIVALSWISFWINYKAAPARVALCITTVLTMITLTAAVQNSLPRVTYTKYSDWILILCLVYVFGALVEFAVINFHDSLETRKRDKLNRKLKKVDSERGSDTGDGEPADRKTRYLQRQLSSLREKMKSFTEQDVNVERIESRSRILFPLTFLIINLMFWIYFVIDSARE